MPILDNEVLSTYIAKIAQTLLKITNALSGAGSGALTKPTDPVHLRGRLGSCEDGCA